MFSIAMSAEERQQAAVAFKEWLSEYAEKMRRAPGRDVATDDRQSQSDHNVYEDLVASVVAETLDRRGLANRR